MAVVGIFLILLGAFFGVTMAGVMCYTRDHIQVERSHHRNPEYTRLLNEYEIMGAVVGALPGVVLLLFSRRRHSKVAP